jgi:hypothetical protein
VNSKVVLTDDNKPKKSVKKNGTKYSIYQITPLHCRRYDRHACKIFESLRPVNDSISADAAMNRLKRIEYAKE